MKKLNQPLRMRAGISVGNVVRETGRALMTAAAMAIAGIAGAQEPCSWSPVADGVTNGAVYAFVTFDDDTGEALYAGGSFTSINGYDAYGVARWDGEMWHALDLGVDGNVRAMAVFDDGAGPALYVGGSFESAGGKAALNIARWDGRSWSALGAGVDGPVRSLEVFDDGSGPALYVGGRFTAAGGETCANIARWDGRAWSAVGEGLENADGDTWVHALEVFDDGNGATLHAGGRFTRSGKVALSHLAHWNGDAWESVGGGVSSAEASSAVGALLTDVDAASPTLYVGGIFDHAGAVAANHIARWDGATWHALQFGIISDTPTNIASLTIQPSGDTNVLYAGGNLYAAGTILARQVARWDGETWSSLDFSISGQSSGNVYALQLFDDGHGLSLFAGGLFTTSNPDPISMRYIARWHLCPLPPTILRVPEEYSTIQQAILAAEDGNEIHVAPGIYSEAIDFLGKEIAIISEDGPEVTILDGADVSGTLVTMASAEGAESRLEGFTITGGSATAGGGLRVAGGAAPRIVRCRFVANTAATGGAVHITSGSAPEFVNCIFEGNTAASGSAISANDAALALTRCSFFDQIASAQATVHLVGGEATITASAFLGNSAPIAAAMLISGAAVSIADSAILNNTSPAGGAIVSASGDLAISGTRFCANNAGDITGNWTDGGENAFLTDCVTDRVIHVPADFASIQEAIDWSLTGFEVIVAPGEYNEAINFNGRAITLRSSDGPEVTVIDGANIVQNAVQFESEERRDSIIDGFTVMNQWVGGGSNFYVRFASSPVIRNCVIRNCTFGLTISDGSSPLVLDCEIRENTSGGVYVVQSTPELTGCVIQDNTGSYGGGGILIFKGCDVVLRDCAVSSNSAVPGGGLLLATGFLNKPLPSTLTAIECRFANNSSQTLGGGIAIQHGTARFVGCSIINNDAAFGAGVGILALADVEFIDCHITDNVSNGYFAGGVGIASSAYPRVVRIEGCYVTGNSASITGGAIIVEDDGQLILADSFICGNTPEQIVGDYIDEGGNVITDICLVADLNHDGVVNVVDLQILLAAWGACPDPDCPADLSGDGAVDVVDLLILLADWS